MIQQVKEPSGKVSGFMSRTLNLHFQKEFLAPPKSTKTGRVQDLVASKSSASLKPLQVGKTKELLVTMWFSPLWVVGCSLSSFGNILPSGMKVKRTPPDSEVKRTPPEAMAHSEVIRRCCKVLDNFDKSLKLLVLFWTDNPPEKTRVSVEKYCRVLVDKVFF